MTQDNLSREKEGTVACKTRCTRPVLRCLKLVSALMALLLVCLPDDGSATYLVFTMEVCQTCEADFHATLEGKDYGPLFLANRLEQYGLKGTFFVNPLCAPGGMDKTISNLRLLVARGHDLELHPHPDYIDPSRPRLTMYSTEERKKILEKGMQTIVRAGAPPPIAYRAADYSIDRKTLSLLPEIGIHMDSSIFPGDSRTDVQLPESQVNRFVRIDGVYELPFTMMRRAPFIGYAGMAALDIDETIWQEEEAALKQITDHGVAVATYTIHFTSFYHRVRSAAPWQRRKVTVPNQENISKLEHVLKLVTSDNRFKVVTARELWRLAQERPGELEGPSFVPYTGLWFTYLKAWKHFIGHSIENKMVALAPIVLVLTILIGATFLLKRRRHRVWKRSES
jgi:peptidoglycan/xylan/chitin deacetylase (PgdA/CDA1 family)